MGKRSGDEIVGAAELSTVAFISTLIVAAIAILAHAESPAILTFLGTAIATAATRLGGELILAKVDLQRLVLGLSHSTALFD